MSKRPADTRTGSSAAPSEPTAAAVSQLVETHLDLVVSYAYRFQDCGLPVIDLIDAGNLGLVEAAHRFDASSDGTFVHCASWWVRQAMIHAIADRSGSPAMTAYALATPLELFAPAGPAEVDEWIAECLCDCDDGSDDDHGHRDIDNSVGDDGDAVDGMSFQVERQAVGTRAHAQRLRSHLN